MGPVDLDPKSAPDPTLEDGNGCERNLEMTMKAQSSRQTERSNKPTLAFKVRSRRPKKAGKIKGGASTLPSKRKNGAKPLPSKVESKRLATQQLSGNPSVAKRVYAAADTERAAHKRSLAGRQKTKTKPEQDVGYADIGGRSKSTNGATNSARVRFDRSLSRIWFDWSSAAMAANSIRMEELMRCRSPLDFVAVGPRCALRAWFGVWLPLLAGQSGERH